MERVEFVFCVPLITRGTGMRNDAGVREVITQGPGNRFGLFLMVVVGVGEVPIRGLD
jgi:hypothetical protein